MRLFLSLMTAALMLTACRQEMDACECGKKLTKPESQEALDCSNYLRTLGEKESDIWRDGAMRCYSNEKLGVDL